jgi:hypothetical protein
VLKSGGEKALTKPLHDETLVKLPLSLDDAEASVKLLHSDTISVCAARLSTVNSIRTVAAAEPAIIKPKTRMLSFKSRLGKILNKLYNLETDNGPEKRLNVDLGVDLYQMENY